MAAGTGLSLAPTDVGLSLERSLSVCEGRAGILGMGGLCGAHLVIVRATGAAAALYEARTGQPWQDVELCLNPKGCGIRNMSHLAGVLELLK